MTTEKQIDEQIQGDYARFYNKIYDGELPEDLIELFKKAFMALSPNTHQYHANKVKEMGAKSVRDLTNLELGMVINLIVSVPPERLYKTFDESVDNILRIEVIRKQYNEIVDKMNQELGKKKERLMGLSGVVRSTKFEPLAKVGL